MKSWITQLTAGVLALASVSLSSCKKDEVQATLAPTSALTLTASTNTLNLQQVNSGNTAVVFTWSPLTLAWSNVDHPYNPSITYTIQLDKKGNNFAAPLAISPGTGPTTTLTVNSLNTSLNDLGLVAGTATALEARLAAQYAPNETPVYSPVVALTATTYLCKAPAGSAAWSIIGPAGVDWNTDIPLSYNCDTNTFDVTRALNAGDFKFRANKDWTLNYGSNSSTGGALAAGGNNITVATAGTYTIKLDLNNMVYSIK